MRLTSPQRHKWRPGRDPCRGQDGRVLGSHERFRFRRREPAGKPGWHPTRVCEGHAGRVGAHSQPGAVGDLRSWGPGTWAPDKDAAGEARIF